VRVRAYGIVGSVVAALVIIALTPADALAWAPGTHILLGEAVLRAADVLLPTGLAALLRAHPYDFLYGSIAADTSFAKRYARVGRHCHHWPVGDEILGRARDERLQAFGYGYLAHLAADVVAHNHFVPHQLAISGAAAGIGHSYWESRFEHHTGERWPRRAREVIELDHGQSDAHLDRILSPTLFSTPTNRRIFRGMVRVNDLESWQRIVTLMAARSRVSLRDAMVAQHLDLAFVYVVDLLAGGMAATPRKFDPAGDESLREAKRLRRAALERGGERVARREAAQRFALPATDRAYVARLAVPLYAPAAARADSN
jgi:hypothetical protein